MSASEIVEILRNNGLIYADQMILTNFVSQGDDHILMFGTWFDTDASGYGNERRIFGKKVVNLQEASNHKSWLIGDFELTHWRKRSGKFDHRFDMFERVQKVKKRMNYNFDEAQKNIAKKF